MTIEVPKPQLQIEFAQALRQIRSQYLQDALSETIEQLDVAEIDRDLQRVVSARHLTALAKHGLRGELLFAVPCVIRCNPRLVGYYRLLLGFSQKEFFTTKFGLTAFKRCELDGELGGISDPQLEGFCVALSRSAGQLLAGLGPESVSRSFLDDLTLLTVGPQLRGGRNVRLGSGAITRVFEIIEAIVSGSVREKTTTHIELLNAARRKVVIRFAADPDIVIYEESARGAPRKIVAIEVKGGTDYSNIHNRIGEAEKSHQKAKARGFTQCWTVVNVERLDLKKAKSESPTTDRFYLLRELESGKGKSYEDFHDMIIGLTGVAT